MLYGSLNVGAEKRAELSRARHQVVIQCQQRLRPTMGMAPSSRLSLGKAGCPLVRYFSSATSQVRLRAENTPSSRRIRSFSSKGDLESASQSRLHLSFFLYGHSWPRGVTGKDDFGNTQLHPFTSCLLKLGSR